MLGGRAPSQLILYHYPELQERGVVLMTAERDPKVMVSPANHTPSSPSGPAQPPSWF